MKFSIALLLLLLAFPAFAESFDGTWQGTNERGGHIRFSIRGSNVREFVEQDDGHFVLDNSCSLGIKRERKSAFVAFRECAVGGAAVAMIDGYRLTSKDSNTLLVRYESRSGRSHDEGEWIRVEDSR